MIAAVTTGSYVRFRSRAGNDRPQFAAEVRWIAARQPCHSAPFTAAGPDGPAGI